MSDDLSGDMLAPSWPNLVFIAFTTSFVILTDGYFRFLQNIIKVSILLLPKGCKEMDLANIGCT